MIIASNSFVSHLHLPILFSSDLWARDNGACLIPG